MCGFKWWKYIKSLTWCPSCIIPKNLHYYHEDNLWIILASSDFKWPPISSAYELIGAKVDQWDTARFSGGTWQVSMMPSKPWKWLRPVYQGSSTISTRVNSHSLGQFPWNKLFQHAYEYILTEERDLAFHVHCCTLRTEQRAGFRLSVQ